MKIVFSLIIISIFIIPSVEKKSEIKHNQQVFQLLKQSKERAKYGLECLPPSKYYAGSCYTYMKMSPASSWEGAYNSCLSSTTSSNAQLLAIESIDEYNFIERDLIGLKSGSESVSVYVGLRKTNNTWLWSNQIPLKETEVYRFWVDNNRDILAYDCGILWLARNTSVITPAPCVEQALRPYVCKHTIDRCYNNSGGCGRFGTCVNLPLKNSFECRCRFLYMGERCEKWSSQGVQLLIALILLFFVSIVSLIISVHRRSTSKRTKELEFLRTSTLNEKIHWDSHSSSLSKSESYRNEIESIRIVLILLAIILTGISCIVIIHTRDHVREHLIKFNRLFQSCYLYENNYYWNLLTLPMALVILLILIFTKTRSEQKSYSIYIPIPFDSFSKVNRFDTMILCGLISLEIFSMIDEILFQSKSTRTLTLHGPLFDIIRQVGLIIIIGLRYYPIYAVVELNHRNLLYDGLCAFYLWFNFALKLFEQILCTDNRLIVRIWQKFIQTNQWVTSTSVSHLKNDDDIYRVAQRFQSTTTSSLTHLSSINWTSIVMNLSSALHPNDSRSTFDQFGLNSSVINVLKYAPYYSCLIYLSLRLTYFFFSNFSRSICCWKSKINEKHRSIKHIYHEPTFSSTSFVTVESQYVRDLFHRTNPNDQHLSMIKSIFYRIYRPVRYFRYSKQILNLYTIGFMFIYYLTFTILQTGFNLFEAVSSFLLMPLMMIYEELDLPEARPAVLKYEIIGSCLLTTFICFLQLFAGLESYQRHMLSVYRGSSSELPAKSAINQMRYMSKHIHYPGYFIAYLALGYLFMGNVLFFVLVILRIVFTHLFLVEDFAKLTIPILMIYLSNSLVHWFFAKTFFLEKNGTNTHLKNLRFYFVFTYFNFFFDCCLGIISCIFRTLKSSVTSLIYFSRLDYPILGRNLEKFDNSFVSYVSFIYMECRHTHPVLIYFCSLVNEKIEMSRQDFKLTKRDVEFYRYRQRIHFRWWLAITLHRNQQLIRLRKHHFNQPICSSRLSTLKKLFIEHHRHWSCREQVHLDSSVNIRNNSTHCTTLLLDGDEHEERRPSF